jgi:hypothetical protein
MKPSSNASWAQSRCRYGCCLTLIDAGAWGGWLLVRQGRLHGGTALVYGIKPLTAMGLGIALHETRR